jgi:hypothetical protein
MFALDHLVIAAESLAEGTAFMEEALGVDLAPGGQHTFMGTHNRLLSLGPDTYLEVIAIDPDLPAPDRARWFGLDTFKGAPRLVSWVWSGADMAQVAQMSGRYGVAEDFARGDLRWQMALPDDSPLGALAPPVLHWDGVKPQDRLPDLGVRLTRLEVQHPQIEDLPAMADPRVSRGAGPAGIQATFALHTGDFTL